MSGKTRQAPTQAKAAHKIGGSSPEAVASACTRAPQRLGAGRRRGRRRVESGAAHTSTITTEARAGAMVGIIVGAKAMTLDERASMVRVGFVFMSCATGLAAASGDGFSSLQP